MLPNAWWRLWPAGSSCRLKVGTNCLVVGGMVVVGTVVVGTVVVGSTVVGRLLSLTLTGALASCCTFALDWTLILGLLGSPDSSTALACTLLRGRATRRRSKGVSWT